MEQSHEEKVQDPKENVGWGDLGVGLKESLPESQKFKLSPTRGLGQAKMEGTFLAEEAPVQRL